MQHDDEDRTAAAGGGANPAPSTPEAWVAPLSCIKEQRSVALMTGPSASPGNDGAGPFSAS